MMKFDFIDATTKGYEFIWHERKYLLRVAIPVFFVKFICLLAIYAIGAQDNFLRQGIINIPYFIIEAIFIIGLIRYFLYREPIFVWGRAITPPQSNIEPVKYDGYLSRKQCIQGGVALYILIKVLGAFMLGMSMDSLIMNHPAENHDHETMELSPIIASFILFTSLAIFTWVFKFLWMFIPVASGYSLSYYLRKMPKLIGLIGMIATWLTCSVPLLIFFSSIINLVAGIFPEDSTSGMVSAHIVQVLAEVIVISVQVIAMTYGINKILSPDLPKS